MKRFLSLLLAIVMVLSLLPLSAFAAQEASVTSYLAFTADVHNDNNNIAANRLNTWINNVTAKIGRNIDVMSFCGDFASANLNESAYWACTQSVIDTVNYSSRVDDAVFIPGNHEFYNGRYSSTTISTASHIQRIGQARNTSDYILYAFGPKDWNNFQDCFDASDINSLDSYLGSLSAADRAKPIFILAHFPMHAFQNRRTTNAGQLISTLNKYGDQGCDIYFIWGHNHTVGDTHYDEVFTGSLDGTPISFTYLAAGCMADAEYGQSATVKGKGLLVGIENRQVVSIACYDANGNVISQGELERTKYLPSLHGWGFEQEDVTPKENEKISEKVYYSIFDKNYWGNVLTYEYYAQKGKHGVCQGMAISSALAYLNRPAVYEWKSSAKTASEIHAGDVENTAASFGLSVKEYIQALYLYQYSFEGAVQEKVHATELWAKNYQPIFDYTNQFYETGENPIVIIIDQFLSEYGQIVGHVLVPYKVEKDASTAKVYVYDCNNISNGHANDKYIEFHYDSNGKINYWEYELWEGTYFRSSAFTSRMSYYNNLTSITDWMGIGKSAESAPFLYSSGEKVEIRTASGEIVSYDRGNVTGDETGGIIPVRIASLIPGEPAEEPIALFYLDNENGVTLSGLSDSSNETYTYAGADSGFTITADGMTSIQIQQKEGEHETAIITPQKTDDVKAVYTTNNGNIVVEVSGKVSDQVKLDANQTAETITVSGFDSGIVTIKQNGSEERETINGGEIEVSIEVASPFADVSKNNYYFSPVLWAVNHMPQITTGVTDDTFMPDRTCTRAHVVTFLWRASGCPEPANLNSNFKDVKDTSKYYYKAVLWAAENGVTTGYSDGTFRPDDECTRAQVVTFLWRANGSPNPTSTTNPFKDVSASAYYAKAVLWALENGITTGKTPTTFNPDGECTRAHVVTFLYRSMN